MRIPGSRRTFLRERREHAHARVTYVELFFDLVFVFAVTQLSHLLVKELSFLGALHTGLLFLAVWWVWIYTTWVTNWVDPERTPVRVLLFVLMLAGLVLSTSIPEAFGARGLPFALAFVFMQVGRSLFMLWAIGGASPTNTRNFQRITIWLSVSGVFWIAGALVGEEARLAVWAVAFAIEFLGPPLGFVVPGLGRSATTDWDVEGAHLAERCALFIIIALGESLLVTGATFAEKPGSAATLAAFVAAFAGSVAMWWIYFDTGAERGSHRIAGSDDPGRIARLAYTYCHVPIVAGIIVAAVGDELVLAHPGGHTELSAAAVLIGAPLLFLAGNLAFKATIAGRPPLSHLAGIGLLVLLGFLAFALSPLALTIATTGVLVLVAVWETRSLRPRRAGR